MVEGGEGTRNDEKVNFMLGTNFHCPYLTPPEAAKPSFCRLRSSKEYIDTHRPPPSPTPPQPPSSETKAGT